MSKTNNKIHLWRFGICVIMWTKKLPKQILDLAIKSFTVSRKFMEILNLSEQKDSYHTIKDLQVKLTFQQTESDNCTLSDIRLMKNESFLEKLSYCVVRVYYCWNYYIFLLELLNEYLTSNCTHVILQSRCKICRVWNRCEKSYSGDIPLEFKLFP